MTSIYRHATPEEQKRGARWVRNSDGALLDYRAVVIEDTQPAVGCSPQSGSPVAPDVSKPIVERSEA